MKVEVAEATDPPATLQSKEHEQLLNIIDRLRSQGISSYIDIPQIIVCGDQSSGKSSCLEAICGLRFPVGDSLCTRFATEYILRRSDEVSIVISIVPDPERPEVERRFLSDFESPTDDLEDFPSIISEAAKVMGIDQESKTFSNDRLRIEITGPSQPHLTLVDLPGLFHAATSKQTDQDREAVASLVKSYMENTRSVILAVVSAKNDLNNQIVTKMARQIDREGNRTLGIITKPDTLHAGSNSEKEFYKLAENKEVRFALGWHVVKNRDYDTRDSSTHERDEAETRFFSTGIWDALPKNQVGVTALRTRLSHVLQNQIISELPNLISEVESGINECKGRLDRLGVSRGTSKAQRSYLHQVSADFTELIKHAIGGQYDDDFFGDPTTDEGLQKRLRAVTNNHLDQFAEDLRNGGHKWQLTENVGSTSAPKKKGPHPISRDDYLDQISDTMQRSRGCELPGMFRPELIGDLFREQSSPWQNMVIASADKAFDNARKTVILALNLVADQTTKEGILRHVINPALESTKCGIDIKVKDIMKQHRTGHPATYNHYFTENIQKLRADHMRKHLTGKLQTFLRANARNSNFIDEDMLYNPGALLDTLVDSTEADTKKFACSEALDYMLAYYKVAMKFVIDDFAIHCIEECLMNKIPNVFTPKLVLDMEDTMIEEIASETQESRIERNSSGKKLEILESALRHMKEYKPTEILSRRQSISSVDSHSVSDDSDPSLVPYA